MCIFDSFIKWVLETEPKPTKTEPKSHKYLLGIRMIYPIYPEPNGSYPKPNCIPEYLGLVLTKDLD